MAFCSLASLVGGMCGPSPENPNVVHFVDFKNCNSDVKAHLNQVCNILRNFLKLINYSGCSYPTRASYSGQVDGFRKPMKNELKTRPCLKTRV